MAELDPNMVKPQTAMLFGNTQTGLGTEIAKIGTEVLPKRDYPRRHTIDPQLGLEEMLEIMADR